MSSYKLVLSDINKPANCKAEREGVVVEPIDSCSVCAVDTVRVLAREGSSDRMGGAKRERCDALKGSSHQLAHRSLFSTL